MTLTSTGLSQDSLRILVSPGATVNYDWFSMMAFGLYTHTHTQASAVKARDYKDATDLVVIRRSQAR